MKQLLSALALMLALVLPSAADAARVFVGVNLTLRAGPDVTYPAVTIVPGGTWITVEGCTDDWYWCDVVYGPNRGWAAGDYLQFEYGNRLVYVPDYGVHFGVPIVTFVFGTYWDHYYRGRPWYRHRDRWSHRHQPIRRPPSRRPVGPSGHGHSHGLPPPSGHRPPPRPPGGHHPSAAVRPPASHPPSHGNVQRPVARPAGHPAQSKPGHKSPPRDNHKQGDHKDHKRGGGN